MTDVRRADPAARRRAVVMVGLLTIAGAVALVAFERYRIPLQDWFSSRRDDVAYRMGLVLVMIALAAAGPLLGLSFYLWSLGARICRVKEFPPPGYRVIRDTAVVRGPAALSRGRGLQLLAVGLALAAGGLSVALWRLARALGPSSA